MMPSHANFRYTPFFSVFIASPYQTLPCFSPRFLAVLMRTTPHHTALIVNTGLYVYATDKPLPRLLTGETDPQTMVTFIYEWLQKAQRFGFSDPHFRRIHATI